MKVFKFATGLALGYVLGSRAGRDKYEQIVAAARKAQNHPALTRIRPRTKESRDSISDSATTGTSADAGLIDAPTNTAYAGPSPRPSRRRPKSALAEPDAATDSQA